jgi:hypothetical protein
MQWNSVMGVAYSILLSACVTSCSTAAGTAEPGAIVWKLENVSRIGDYAATVVGSPRIEREGKATAICFDGASDAIFIPINPIAGWSQFTIEALIQPDATGPDEQRFLHIQDERESRLLLETRLTENREWALDTFLLASPEVRLTLLDREKLHSAEQWHWVALSFDGETMAHYVDGRKELEGEIAFRPMTSGRMSLGVRINKVSWYKGCIREVRFTPRALQTESLQH